VLRPLRSNLPIIASVARRPSMDVGAIVRPIARAAQSSGGRTLGKLLVIVVGMAALGTFAGLNIRLLTEEDDPEVPAMTTQVAPGPPSVATASERVQARGTLAPRKEARPRR
jgi:hypothetical protein